MKDITLKYLKDKPDFYKKSFLSKFNEQNIRFIYKLFISNTIDEIISNMSSYEKTRLYFIGFNKYDKNKIDEDLSIGNDVEAAINLSSFDKYKIVKYCYIMNNISDDDLKSHIHQMLNNIYNNACNILEIKINDALILI